LGKDEEASHPGITPPEEELLDKLLMLLYNRWEAIKK